MKIIKLLIFFLTLAGFALIAAVESIASGSVQVRKETLAGVTPNATAEYNGIVLPLTWPPKNVSNLNKYTDTQVICLTRVPEVTNLR